MTSLLFLVFLMQLFLHTLNKIDANTLTELVWLLICGIPLGVKDVSMENQRHRTEVLRLKAQLGQISAQDDFAKWAKVQRLLDKANSEYERTSSKVSSTKQSIKSIVSASRFVGSNGLRFIIPWWYTTSPMFWLPQGWVPYYLEWIVSFPRAPLGSVSIQTWAMACASIIILLNDTYIGVVNMSRSTSNRGNGVVTHRPNATSGKTKE